MNCGKWNFKLIFNSLFKQRKEIFENPAGILINKYLLAGISLFIRLNT